MKKGIISLILISFVAILMAHPVKLQLAESVANMKIQIEEKSDYTINDVYTMKNEDQVLAYVFHLSPMGFIAVSTDTDITPVITYSFRNNFIAEDIRENIGYQMLRNDMQLRHKGLTSISNSLKAKNNQTWENYENSNFAAFNLRDGIWPPEGYSSTGGWIEVLYDQSAPYNTLCPLDPETGDRVVTGCVSTAMAMIMQYHHQIGDPVFNDGDDYISQGTYPYIYIDDDHNTYDFPSFPELNDYIDDLKTNLEAWTPLTNDDKAALHFAAGITVEMEYASGGSGAMSYDVAPALISKFDFSTATYVNQYNINPTFYSNLQDNMMNAKPAYLGIIQSGAPYGHAIISDGYNESDGTYHLNMGWGGNSNGWYSLPQDMPGFNTITSAVINIEDDSLPFEVSGQVITNGADVTDTYVTIDGPRSYEGPITDPNGYFNFDWVVEGNYTCTALIELEDGGYEYQSQELFLDEDNNTVIFFLEDYGTLTAEVTAPISSEGTHVAVYDDYGLVTSGVADADGNVSMPGLLPGEYYSIASLNGNYFDVQDYTVTANNQNILFDLDHYPYDHIISFAGDPTGQFQLLPTMSCGIRLSGEDIVDYENDAISKVKFIAPFNPEDGQLYSQIWWDDYLISEVEITEFSDGEWVSSTLDDFAIIYPDQEYYVGYKIATTVGTPAAYHDEGPWIEGKGAYIKTAGWIPIPPTYDYNFCIKAVIASQSPTGSDNNEIPEFVNRLHGNYPNPFNPSSAGRSTTTTISYSLQNTEDVLIEVFNIKGQKVKTLVDSKQDKGEHSLIWNGKDDNDNNVSSGIYFYKMKSGGRYTSTKKMILMK